MYIKLGTKAAKVVGISTNDTVSTFAIKGQDGISTVLDNIGTEIRLYDDESCTKLTAIYKADKIVRISFEPDKKIVSVTVQATRVSDIEAEQIKEDLAHQRETISEQGFKLEEQMAKINEQESVITAQGAKVDEQASKIAEQTTTIEQQAAKIEEQVSKITTLEDELAAAKILLGIEEGE